MPYEMQVSLMASYMPHAAVLNLDPPGPDMGRNWDQVYRAIELGSCRFLVHWRRKHIVCARITFDEHRRAVGCVVMDTCSRDSPESSRMFLDYLRTRKSLPDAIRNATIDKACPQQPNRMGGCAVMSVCNMYKRRDEMATYEEGEWLRACFATRLFCEGFENVYSMVDQWESAFRPIIKEAGDI